MRLYQIEQLYGLHEKYQILSFTSSTDEPNQDLFIINVSPYTCVNFQYQIRQFKFSAMSNKNLKVYKMQFITEVRKLTMNVKFACKMKMTWKRSNECAESTWVPLQAGTAHFDQTLKLKVNMYFDTTTNKFVEKKCLYSFVISTEKGEKSAGSITIDLAEFFNKRIYDMEKEFSIDKCPVAGTKIQMKIFYQEQATEQTGYDSMSCISATNPMDSSVASVDLTDLAPTKSNLSEKQQQTQKSSDLSNSKAEGDHKQKQQQQKYLNLDASDVMQSPTKNIHSDGTKIGENIKSINSLTAKINQFVTDKSKNIKYEIQGFRRKINGLEEQVQGEKNEKEKIEGQLAEEKRKNGVLQKEYSDFKVEMEHKLEIETKKNQELQTKHKNSQEMMSQLQLKMSESGQSQTSYIQQLKDNHKNAQIKFNEELEEIRSSLVQEKKDKNNLKTKMEQLDASLKDLRERYENAVQRNETMENDMRRKEEEMEATRVNLQRAFQNLVKSLNSVI